MDREKVKSAIIEISLSAEPFQSALIEPTAINFFYGKNGSGKTSISRAIKDGIGLTWKTTEPEGEYDRLVFNRDFIQQNLMLHDRLPGVFTISEADIAVQGEIKKKSEEKKQLDAKATSLGEQLTAKKGEDFVEKTIFTESCWNLSKTARTIFKQEMQRYLKDSKKLADYILEGVFVQGQRIQPVDHGYEALQELHNTAHNSDAKTYPLFRSVDANTFPECALLDQVVTNSGDSPFATFIKTLGATSWVRQGHESYHTGSKGLCPYCMQKLPENFEEEFAACFDQQYQASLDTISQFLTEYRTAGLAIHKTLTENTTDCYAAKGLDSYKDKLAEFVKMMQDNLDLIREKVQDPTKKIVLYDIGVIIGEINTMITDINTQIWANNDVVNAQADKQKECMRFVWEQLLFDLQDALTRYNNKKKAIADETKVLFDELQSTQNAAKALESEITALSQINSNTQAAVISINARLKDAGFDGFFIREKADEPNMYEVVRSNGKTAKNLSEGEINFIAFLYFYHLVYGSDKAGDVSKKKIVVIDDPVSSMDSDVLFLVSALVRDLIEICRNNADITAPDGEDFIKQIFILTHNAYFHQEISYSEEANWDYVSFYILKKEHNVSTVEFSKDYKKGSPSIEVNKNPVRNTYVALWDEYEEVTSPIALLNVMRRILEYYFLQISRCDSRDLNEAILIDHKADFIDVLPDGTEDRRRYNQAKAMLSYLAVNRIGITDGLHYIDDFKDIDLCKRTFEDIFRHMGQHQHFVKMTAIKH